MFPFQRPSEPLMSSFPTKRTSQSTQPADLVKWGTHESERLSDSSTWAGPYCLFILKFNAIVHFLTHFSCLFVCLSLTCQSYQILSFSIQPAGAPSVFSPGSQRSLVSFTPGSACVCACQVSVGFPLVFFCLGTKNLVLRSLGTLVLL